MRLSLRAAATAGGSAAVACAVVLTLSAEAYPWWPEAAAARPAPAQPPHVQLAVRQHLPLPVLLASAGGRYRDGLATGPAVSAYYGLVQVQAVIHDGRIETVRVLRRPDHYATSRSINRRALPRLQREVIKAQDADVHAVSGATLTSHAFIRSMNAALRRARG